MPSSHLGVIDPPLVKKISTSCPGCRAQPEPAPTLPESELTPDLLAIGAGPVDLSTAAVAADYGLDVVLADERGKLGGQYYKQPAPDFNLDEPELDVQYRRGRALVARAHHSGVHILDEAKVWGAFAPDHVVAASPVERWVICAKRVVLATGTYERGMTTGAAQILSRSYQVSAGKRVLVAGNGSLNMQVAAELSAAGARVVALVELATPVRPANLLHVASRASGSVSAFQTLAREPRCARCGSRCGPHLSRDQKRCFLHVRAERDGTLPAEGQRQLVLQTHLIERTHDCASVHGRENSVNASGNASEVGPWGTPEPGAHGCRTSPISRRLRCNMSRPAIHVVYR